MRALMRDLSRGAFTYAAPTITMLDRAMDIDREYRDLGLGYAAANDSTSWSSPCAPIEVPESSDPGRGRAEQGQTLPSGPCSVCRGTMRNRRRDRAPGPGRAHHRFSRRSRVARPDLSTGSSTLALPRRARAGAPSLRASRPEQLPSGVTRTTRLPSAKTPFCRCSTSGGFPTQTAPASDRYRFLVPARGFTYDWRRWRCGSSSTSMPTCARRAQSNPNESDERRRRFQQAPCLKEARS
jgi:hypothetical protein